MENQDIIDKDNKQPKSCIEELKEDYEKARKIYDIPSFEELNINFQIEKIAEIETDFLLLEVRKHISEKLSNYLKLTETLINPVSAQIIVYHMIKTLTTKDQEKMREIYKKLAKLEIKIIELDLNFNEEKEAMFIKKAFNEWQILKKDLTEIIISIQEKIDTKIKTKDSNYFG